MRRPLVLIPQHFGSLLFDGRLSRYYPFDHASTRFLRDLVSYRDAVAVERQPDPDAAHVGCRFVLLE